MYILKIKNLYGFHKGFHLARTMDLDVSYSNFTISVLKKSLKI